MFTAFDTQLPGGRWGLPIAHTGSHSCKNELY